MDEGCIFLKMNLLLSAPGQIRGKKIPSSNPRTISHSSIIRFNFFGKKTRRSLFPFPIKQKDLPMQSQFFISNWTHSALLKPQPNINANKSISRFPWFVPSSQALRSPAASLIVRLRPLGRRSYLTPFNLLMLGFSGKTIEAADRGSMPPLLRFWMLSDRDSGSIRSSPEPTISFGFRSNECASI